ncbi:MAG: VOC family protein [Verrucomicrobia bacterium]|nr:VOC family protein [Verrucomicrobiota bacterium]
MTTTTKNGAQGIHLAWIVVKDLDAAIKYYTEILGMVLKTHTPMFGWAELQGSEGGAILGLAEANYEMDFKPGSNAIVTLTVSDIDASIKAFKDKGMECVGEMMEVPGHVKLQLFTDPSGNSLQIVQKL